MRYGTDGADMLYKNWPEYGGEFIYAAERVAYLMKNNGKGDYADEIASTFSLSSEGISRLRKEEIVRQNPDTENSLDELFKDPKVPSKA